MTGPKITDPAVLEQLNAAPRLRKVTDEGVLFELNNGPTRSTAGKVMDFIRGVPSLPLEVNKDIERGAYQAGGAVTDATGSPGLGYAANVALQAVPAVLGSGIGGTVATASGAPAAMKGVARVAMQSATKPPLAALESGEAARGIETLLREGYNPSMGGVKAMQKRITQLSAEVADAIKNSPATIDKDAIGSRLNDAVQKFTMQVNPNASVAAVRLAWDEFLNHPLFKNIDFTTSGIPVQTAQAMKTGTYARLGESAYGEFGTAATEAQKGLARGLKEEISAAVPAVSAKNATIGDLIEARDLASRRALMSGNRNFVGLGALAENPGAAAGFLADRSDTVKAWLARLLYSGSQQIPRTAGQAAGGTVGAMMGREERK